MALRAESVIWDLDNSGNIQLDIRSSEATRRAPVDPDDMFKGGMAMCLGLIGVWSPREKDPTAQVTLSPGPIGLVSTRRV